MREDLRRETERYGLIESKYKDLLVKYNVLAKENAKNAEMLFSMNTGGQIKNYDNYLERSAHDDSRVGGDLNQRASSKGFSKGKSGGNPLGGAGGDYSYERNFEDVF